jgi:hypothetical protein
MSVRISARAGCEASRMPQGRDVGGRGCGCYHRPFPVLRILPSWCGYTARAPALVHHLTSKHQRNEGALVSQSLLTYSRHAQHRRRTRTPGSDARRRRGCCIYIRTARIQQHHGPAASFRVPFWTCAKPALECLRRPRIGHLVRSLAVVLGRTGIASQAECRGFDPHRPLHF